MSNFYEKVKERLIRYAKIDSQSDNYSNTTPTTMKQFDMARELEKELKEIGVSDVYLDEDKCVVYGHIPGNTDKGKDVGFVCHIDTSFDAPGSNVKPWVLNNYDGKDIVLNKEENIVMSVKEFPNLLNYVGQDLILTDGTTLLGGDDKAAIASVMTMAQYYCSHPEVKHGFISLALTPDEEVGGLAKDLDLERFKSKVAYTLDGDYLGYYEEETFNASQATIQIKGRSVHPGTAKGIMKNAVDIGSELLNRLPHDEKPQYTEGREGFYHVIDFNGTCEESTIHLIIRDHDKQTFINREKYLNKIVEELNIEYDNAISLEIVETYANMKEVIDTVPYMVPTLKKAIEDCGIKARSIAFRGGTDGAALSFRGLPCPNLSAGYENAHGRFEYVPIQSMEKNVEILLRLCELYGEME